MGSPRAPGAADRLLRSRAPRAKRLADERRAFGAPAGFRDTRASQTFRISLETRASVDYILFASPFALALVVARCNRRRTLSLSRSQRVNPNKDTEDADGTTRTVSVVPRRDALTSRRTADRSRATEFESRMAIHSSSSSTSARARRAVAQDVASRVKRIDASRHYAAQIIEILVEMTRADDARERRRRARVRARGHILFRARDIVGSSGVVARRARVEDDRNGRRARAGGWSSQRTRDDSD